MDKTKLAIGVFVAFLSLGFVAVYFYYLSPKEPPEDFQIRNLPQEVREGEWQADIEKALQLSREGKRKGAVKILRDVLSQMTDDMAQRSVVDLIFASLLFKDKETKLAGAKRYAAIAGTESYPRTSRAYAMLVVADNFDGTRNKLVLEPFFSQSEYTKKNGTELVLELYGRLYDTYPFGLAAGRLALAHIARVRDKNTISDNDYVTVTRYLDDINGGSPFLEMTEPFRGYIPVTLLAKARLLRVLENVGRPTTESIDDIYRAVVARARLEGVPATEQFGILLYADYLAEKQQKEEVIRLLTESELSSSILEGTVANLLATNWPLNVLPHLYALQKNDQEVRVLYEKLLK